MHIVERYALGCGVKIDRPFIYDKYFPMLAERYITLHTTSKGSKTYSFWQEVIDILLPILDKAGISIVQVGGKEDKPMSFVYSTLGQTSINQTAHIIKNSLLHLGADSFPTHIAGYYDVPLVALYSNNYAKCVGPYWGSKDKQILLEPKNRDSLKPSFSFEETPKTINTIYPESIAKSVCQLLNLPFNYEYETVYIGENFGELLLETLPNHVVNPQQFGVNQIIVRMDYWFSEQNLARQLQQGKCVIVTNRPIDPRLLRAFKQNIPEIHYEVDKFHSHPFVADLLKLGIKHNMFTFLPEEELRKIKINYLDLGVIYPQVHGMPDEVKKLENAELYYKSCKFSLSNGKIYPSKYAIDKDRPIAEIGNHLCPVPKDEASFWVERRNFRIVKKL